MKRCLDLASLGFGKVAPNPMVGALIVQNGIIISSGYHAHFGGAHAERAAIEGCLDKTLLRGSDLYVNLEPCSHHGKTPPCTDLIIKSEIKRVFIGASDPNPFVRGKGANILREAGIEVFENISEAACRDLNKRFYLYHTSQRPYVILKWAQSKNGIVGSTSSEIPLSISCEASKALSHKWRNEEQAICVGTETALRDNPRLTSRLPGMKNPVRVLIDRSLRVPPTHHVFNNEARTFVFTASKAASKGNVRYIHFDKDQFAMLPHHILYYLYLQEIQSVMIEGGPKTIQEIINYGIWDEARVFTSDVVVEGNVKANTLDLEPSESFRVGTDLLNIYKRI